MSPGRSKPWSPVLGGVEDEVGAITGAVAGEERLLLGHPVLPELLRAGENAVAGQATRPPHRCRRIDPDGVRETADRLAAGAGDAFEDHGGRPGPGPPLAEGVAVPV